MSRPDIPWGYLGAKSKFEDLGLSLDSHPNAEFKINWINRATIKLNTNTPVKTTTKLIHCNPEGEEELLSSHVMSQRTQTQVIYDLIFPKNGWYKFEIFALPESNPDNNLPQVFNYLIQVVNHRKTEICLFPKIYSILYDRYCHLYEPRCLKKGLTAALEDVLFKVKVPGAKAVAVKANKEWRQLTNKEDEWEGRVDLSRFSGKDTKVKLCACFGTSGDSYSILVQYTI